MEISKKEPRQIPLFAGEARKCAWRNGEEDNGGRLIYCKRKNCTGIFRMLPPMCERFMEEKETLNPPHERGRQGKAGQRDFREQAHDSEAGEINRSPSISAP